MELKGLKALVCGASQGIGRATAISLAKAGARVALLARDNNQLQGVLQELPLTDGPHTALAVDLSDLERLDSALKGLVKSWGTIQILICNAGGPKPGALTEASDEEFLLAFKTHVLANQRLVKALAPGMKDAKYGRIVNIISTSVKAPIANLGVSNTIRAAVANWSKTLANELGPFGITVNNILPGYTKTPRLQALIEGTAKNTSKSSEQITNEWQQSIPLKRFAEPQETAECIRFLVSPQASYINGINMPVDGGRTASL